ncbi:DUF4199 domain-containing protein [Flavobacterium sp. SM15]|uniref:DUF4199 domain-containing protein n=1 Tax=Flavobacterium sp. SM15 TaxID=2908005 RepID=UPI001EDA1AF6|nr:DUF4199 domain-containing protein [Flavobacterium sp. SM15]MCG2612472.1 DUF4199 domain-containing protein [Flavobacterium sp. SM15]
MKNFAIEIKWGLIYIVASLLWMALEKTVGLHDVHIDKHPIYTMLFLFVAIAVYSLAIRDKKKNFFKGEMTWKQGFVSGIVMTIVAALLTPLMQYITSAFITPDFFKNAIAYAVEHNKVTREQAESYFNMKSYITQATFGTLSFGVVISAISAFFNKSK